MCTQARPMTNLVTADRPHCPTGLHRHFRGHVCVWRQHPTSTEPGTNNGSRRWMMKGDAVGSWNSQSDTRYLDMCQRFPDQPLVPSCWVDDFWHLHILDTIKYAEDCNRFFGYFLHHFPCFGMRGESDKEELSRCWSETLHIYQGGGVEKNSSASCGQAPKVPELQEAPSRTIAFPVFLLMSGQRWRVCRVSDQILLRPNASLTRRGARPALRTGLAATCKDTYTTMSSICAPLVVQ